MNPVNVIGMGQGIEDLTQTHLNLIQNCDVLVGGKRHLELFKSSGKKQLAITGDINGLIGTIKELIPEKKIVVLASGDPLFYGIGSTLTKHIDTAYLKIHSNISSISAAFAAIKMPWQDAKIISLHGRQKENFSFASLLDENKIAFLTDPHMDPEFIAQGMLNEGIFEFKTCVLENLGGGEKEKISWFDTPEQIKNQVFSQPNVVILIKTRLDKKEVLHETHFGMDDELFKHDKGLITKSEIRTISLSKLKLIKKDHVLWDIGSGSGSVGIEASFQIPWGLVFAIEKHSDRISDIIHNINNFNCSNIKVLNAAFPEGVEELKTPDRVFIGGGGNELGSIIDAACEKLSQYGVIVINTVILQSMNTALTHLKKNNFKPNVIQVQVSRSKEMPFGDRLEALNPVWIISGSKP